MLIRFQNGSLIEAVILSLQGPVMRLALKGGDDVVELHLLNNVWLTEDCEPVTFDFTLAVLAAVGIVPPDDLPLEEAAVTSRIAALPPASADYLN